MTPAPECTANHNHAFAYRVGDRLVTLPCGCQDVHYADGTVCFEHAHAECREAGVLIAGGELKQVGQ